MSASDGLPPDDAADAPDDGDAMLAIDFAIGTLDGAALRAAELRLRRDPGFARDVADWQARLAPLADAVAPVASPASVWTAVEAELFRGPPATAAPTAGWWTRLGLWQALTAGTGVVAAVALALLVVRPDGTPGDTVVAGTGKTGTTPVPSGRVLAATMTSADKAAAVMLTATYDPTNGAVTLTPAADDKRRGLTPELWVIVGKQPPRSLGLIDLRGTQAHRIPDALRAELKDGATLAISLEPAGGSPTGTPTGPVVATGTLAPI